GVHRIRHRPRRPAFHGAPPGGARLRSSWCYVYYLHPRLFRARRCCPGAAWPALPARAGGGVAPRLRPPPPLVSALYELPDSPHSFQSVLFLSRRQYHRLDDPATLRPGLRGARYLWDGAGAYRRRAARHPGRRAGEHSGGWRVAVGWADLLRAAVL